MKFSSDRQRKDVLLTEADRRFGCTFGDFAIVKAKTLTDRVGFATVAPKTLLQHERENRVAVGGTREDRRRRKT